MNMSNNEWNIAQPGKKYALTNENVPNKINVAFHSKQGKRNEWQSTHPPYGYQLTPHTKSTPVNTRLDQLNPNGREGIQTHPLQASIPDQLIPSHRPSVNYQLIPNS